MSGDERMQSDCQIPMRFTVSQRLEHMVLILSFTMLSVTGLVQKYPMNPVSDYLMTLMGGIQATRVLHRVAAVVFALLGVYHVLVVAHKYYVRRVPMTMMPTAGDLLDGFRWIRYSLFLRKDPPRMPRYNFAEKLEYWALIWGGIIMVLTGFMLWNPLMTTLFLPGQVIPAAKAAHGGEAVLAVLAIIVWHFYHVHLKMFNKSMFTGKLTRHQMEEEHGAEWSEIRDGAMPLTQDPGPLRRRQILFMPIAAVSAALALWGIYWAATAEATAISTVPMQVYKTPIYSPETPPAPDSSKRAVIAAPGIPHPIAGQEKCYACHSRTGMKPVPANHEGRPIESCRICHKPLPAPKAKAPVEEKTAAGGPKPIPHSIEAAPYKNCTNCHGAGKMKPYPENHAAFPVESCAACHKPPSSK
ncbi:MAG: cytochrome b/b6 domain-containing protein [Acidobacteriota bacterium]|nr:cytochrome b/b6 domain-containing protein [Acidobacteriota bacterium]